jgi:hypothetical protein
MAATVRDGRRDNVDDGTPFDLGGSQTGSSKSRVPEILVGTFLVALFALAGAWFYAQSTQSTGYLALSTDIRRGHEITVSDLTVFDISTESPLRGTPNISSESVIGKVALVDMAAGTLITGEQLADAAQIPAGQGIVGLALSPGEYPTRSLRSGDLVRVAVMPLGGQDLATAEVTVVADSATVIEVADGGGDELFISLTLPSELADQVAAADSQNRVRLIQVSEG